MKKLLTTVSLFCLLPITHAQAAVYQIDTDASNVTWKATKVTGAHNGEIQLQSGWIEFEGEQLADGRAVIDMESIVVLDIQDPENNQKLESHLKSDDFFGVAKHPTAEMEILEAKAGENNKYDLVGSFTIKSITQEVPFTATVNRQGDQLTARAAITLDRSLFDVRYGSGKFFENLGDKLIHDEFILYVDIVANAE